MSISTGLNECATNTTVEEDEIVFKNRISIKKRSNKYGIVLNTDVDINVQEMTEKDYKLYITLVFEIFQSVKVSIFLRRC